MKIYQGVEPKLWLRTLLIWEKVMLKIAIVEDERECQEALIEHLRKYEKEKNEAFIVRIFNDGIDILDDYSADYDLIFLDIHMKYQDGMTTAKRIREVDADAQIVFITALAQYAIEGYKVNALDFILKPVVYEQLTTMQDRQCTVYFTRSQTARA